MEIGPGVSFKQLLKYGIFFHIFLYDENFDVIFAQFTPPPFRKCMNINQLEISNASLKKEVPKSRLLSLKSQPHNYSADYDI